MAHQSIITKFIGPSNVKGSRVKARCDAKSITVDWDHALNPTENHAAAALQLIAKLNWSGRWAQGSLPNAMGGDCFVCLERYNAPTVLTRL